MYSEIVDKYCALVKPFLLNLLHLTNIFGINFQPLPTVVGQHSESSGGNDMGLRASDPNCLILTFQGSWALSIDDKTVYSISRLMTDWLAEKVPQ